MLTTVSDEATIAELRTLPDFVEANPVAEPEPVVVEALKVSAAASKPAPVAAPVVVAEAEATEPAAD